jgi:hypothetical protein
MLRPVGTPEPGNVGSAGDPERPISRRGWVVIGLVVLLANVALIHRFVLRGEAPVTVTADQFRDDFDRAALGDDYFTVGGHWRIDRGSLLSPGAMNDPLWLEMRLPESCAISFEARVDTAAADVRFEAFGDGRDQASGYLFVFGGMNKSASYIARPEEREAARQNGRRPKALEPGRAYRMRVERVGARIRWLVDGVELLVLDDPKPLHGKGHDRFGLSSDETTAIYDHLEIAPIAAFTAAGQVPVAAKATDPLLGAEFLDDFSRGELGGDYRVTGPGYRIEDGMLAAGGARNHPLWLRRRLPPNVQVDFDVVAQSPDGDIKVELFGDGEAFATSLSYTATSYVLVFGGWKNSRSEIARMDEHGKDVAARSDVPVVPGQRYHWTLTRRGNRLEWLIDGKPFLALDDPQPLQGPGHDHFALNAWDAESRFDNLVIRPL